MSDLDQRVLQKVMQWLSHADEDLRLAKHALTLTSGCPYRLIAYHAQQCAEKYLKACLVHKRIDFPYTHNIVRLLKLCAEQASWAETIRDAEDLTPYAITARYPGEEVEVTQGRAQRAIQIAEQVKQVVQSALAQEGVKPPEETTS